MAEELRDLVHGNAARGHLDGSAVAQLVWGEVDEVGAFGRCGEPLLF